MNAGIFHTENPSQENLVCMRPVEVSGQIFSDQTGRFPRVPSRGNRSVMVLYDYNSNSILIEILKNNRTQELVRAQTRLVQYMFYRGLKPTSLRIDNKCPEALKIFCSAKNVNFQMCPPNDNRTNQAETLIDTWKCHFLTGLSWVYPNLPLRQWCSLLPQATQTLNLLHRSWIKPRLSAEAQLNRVFD